jgi:hypothetical protein
MLQRSTSHPDSTFEERLAEHKASLELKAARLEPGPKRDELLRKAQQIDTAVHINAWLNSLGLQAPKCMTDIFATAKRSSAMRSATQSSGPSS